MDGPLLDFFRAARSAGLRISPAESIDASRAVRVVGWEDRARLRDTLSLVLAKTVEEKRRFEECFDLFFRRDGFRGAAEDEAEPPPSPPEGAPPGLPEGGAAGAVGSGLGRMLLAGDRAGLAAAMAAAAEEVGVSRIAVFTQVNLFARRILERMDLAGLERDIAAHQGTPIGARLRQGRDMLREEAQALARQNLELYAQGESERWRERMLAQTRLAAIDRRDHERMRVLVRTMARRLAVLYGRTRKRDRRGMLDARRTLRRNMGWGGVPFLTVWKRRKLDRPRLVVLCDVSGSVAAVAQFLLLFLYAMKEALSGLRAFAFSGSLIEVSDILEREPIEKATAEIMARIGFGSSNYGNSLVEFERGFMPILDRRTTVIILGDGRGNRTDPRVDVLQRMANRAKQVIWLNPEPRTLWGTGDSDMPRYAPHCRVTAVCSTLKHLDRVVTALLEGEG
ncbi:VWA domain-containing protein [Crenalkalicoccus roseus]|uniref:VWA domain-containing protein n=1 Tax=Crenalkalicoccus roseus TaxID=1485588 RepID=UPI00108145C9|nr:VWA domain-containing protein [Crenalkalicoccus roseus]